MLKIVITWANLARGDEKRGEEVFCDHQYCLVQGCGLCVAICPKSVLELNEHIKAEPVHGRLHRMSPV